MARKDRFKEMQESGVNVLNSFQDIAATVASIENQGKMSVQSQYIGSAVKRSVSETTPENISETANRVGGADSVERRNIENQERFMRLPNPQIPLAEYNAVSAYCNSFDNMTRQDFVELAIIEKLHRDGQMSEEDFNRRNTEIRNRLPRGKRKGTRQSKG